MAVLKIKTERLAKFGVLIGLRESYLLARNVCGLYFHPFLTTKKIMKEKDYSQGVLLFGLPAYLWLGWVCILLISRIFFFQRLQFGFWAKTSFLLISLAVAMLFLFLGYWVLEVFKNSKFFKQ